MARPGGNTTGVSILANDLDAKRLEVLHDYASFFAGPAPAWQKPHN